MGMKSLLRSSLLQKVVAALLFALALLWLSDKFWNFPIVIKDIMVLLTMIGTFFVVAAQFSRE
jgi:hypothetical protein